MCWVKSDRQLRRCVFCGRDEKKGNKSSRGVMVGGGFIACALGLPLITQKRHSLCTISGRTGWWAGL